jgi:ATP-dependent DNA ligase
MPSYGILGTKMVPAVEGVSQTERKVARSDVCDRLLLRIMPKKSSFARQAAGFIETMDCLPVSKLHEGPEWTYETKLDGYRLEAVRRAGRTTLYFRRQNVPNQKFHYIATALQDLPNDAVALKVGSSFRLQARRVDPQRILG